MLNVWLLEEKRFIFSTWWSANTYV